ncbi:MAG TPA: damage-inducible protein CinA [Parvularcula sp.]|nr:damage-inducible protein CinA [Parvularcula sp.]HBS30343.1 damage-inducible protein CinA [Parvularcula sp.]HBS35665.1 damage-inducible protein CinA [Parvularcula sp.]
MTQPHRIRDLARRIVDKAGAKGLLIAAAESCTGGMIASAITDVPGASAVLDRGFVTYSNEAKIQMLAIPPALIARHGAVSGPVARAMAAGALARSRADIAVAVTGVAGPSGGSAAKPVGLVWFGLAVKNGAVRVERRMFMGGERTLVRLRATQTALQLVLNGL